MTERTDSVAYMVRAVLDQRPDHAHTYAEIYEALRAAGLDTDKRRDTVMCNLRYLVGRGYAKKTGIHASATFQATGLKLQKPRLQPGEAARRRLAHARRKRAGKVRPTSPATPRAEDRNTIVKAKPVRATNPLPVVVETVDQFRARAGKVQRLPAHWEQAA